MTRSVPEWIGKSPDEKIPPRVRLRVFERAGGVCHISKRKIAPGEPWQVDHVIALVNGGEHRESNMAPALVGPHRDKTKADVAEKASINGRRASHVGVKRDKPKILAPQKAGRAPRDQLPVPPPRAMFRPIAAD